MKEEPTKNPAHKAHDTFGEPLAATTLLILGRRVTERHHFCVFVRLQQKKKLEYLSVSVTRALIHQDTQTIYTELNAWMRPVLLARLFKSFACFKCSFFLLTSLPISHRNVFLIFLTQSLKSDYLGYFVRIFGSVWIYIQSNKMSDTGLLIMSGNRLNTWTVSYLFPHDAEYQINLHVFNIPTRSIFQVKFDN